MSNVAYSHPVPRPSSALSVEDSKLRCTAAPHDPGHLNPALDPLFGDDESTLPSDDVVSSSSLDDNLSEEVGGSIILQYDDGFFANPPAPSTTMVLSSSLISDSYRQHQQQQTVDEATSTIDPKSKESRPEIEGPIPLSRDKANENGISEAQDGRHNTGISRLFNRFRNSILMKSSDDSCMLDANNGDRYKSASRLSLRRRWGLSRIRNPYSGHIFAPLELTQRRTPVESELTAQNQDQFEAKLQEQFRRPRRKRKIRRDYSKPFDPTQWPEVIDDDTSDVDLRRIGHDCPPEVYASLFSSSAGPANEERINALRAELDEFCIDAYEENQSQS